MRGGEDPSGDRGHGQRGTPVQLPPPLPGAPAAPPSARGFWRYRGAQGDGVGVGTLALPPIQASPPLPAPTTTGVVLFLQLHLPLDRSWWCRDSAPQGARSTGSYIPRSGGELWMPSQMEGSALSLGVLVAQV